MLQVRDVGDFRMNVRAAHDTSADDAEATGMKRWDVGNPWTKHRLRQAECRPYIDGVARVKDTIFHLHMWMTLF